MIRSALFWRLFLGGFALLVSGLVLGGAMASDRVDAVLVWAVALLAGAGVALAAGRLAKRARGLLARAAALGSPAEAEDAVGGDEFARLEVLLEENEARFVEQVEQLKAERNRLTAVLGGMVEGVVAIDRDRRVLHLNAVAANWFGRPAPELALGRPIYELSRQPEISGALIEAMEKRTQVSRTFALVRFAGEDGGPNRFELNASPLLSSRRDGELVEGAVAVIHDITELERLESVRRDFVSNVSHELKTPLTAIHGYVETLLEADPIDGPTRGRFLRKIRRQSNRLGALVSDLLTLSRIEVLDRASGKGARSAVGGRRSVESARSGQRGAGVSSWWRSSPTRRSRWWAKRKRSGRRYRTWSITRSSIHRRAVACWSACGRGTGARFSRSKTRDRVSRASTWTGSSSASTVSTAPGPGSSAAPAWGWRS